MFNGIEIVLEFVEDFLMEFVGVLGDKSIYETSQRASFLGYMISNFTSWWAVWRQAQELIVRSKIQTNSCQRRL